MSIRILSTNRNKKPEKISGLFKYIEWKMLREEKRMSWNKENESYKIYNTLKKENTESKNKKICKKVLKNKSIKVKSQKRREK